MTIQNKAPGYDRFVEKIEDKKMIDKVKKINGNTFEAHFKKGMFGELSVVTSERWLMRVHKELDGVYLTFKYI